MEHQIKREKQREENRKASILRGRAKAKEKRLQEKEENTKLLEHLREKYHQQFIDVMK